MSIFHNIYEALSDAAYIWRQEMKQVFRDEGVLIFFIIVPIVYPLLYSWIYNNEVIHEVPVAVVDLSHSHFSRQFIRQCDASPDVRVAYYAEDLDDAQSLVSRQVVKGIYLIPSDFATNLNRMEQGVVSVYCDMSLMLTYKAIYQTSVAVTQAMGAEIQKKVSGNYTDREDMITTRPLDFEDVPIFNPAGGYGNLSFRACSCSFCSRHLSWVSDWRLGQFASAIAMVTLCLSTTVTVASIASSLASPSAI